MNQNNRKRNDQGSQRDLSASNAQAGRKEPTADGKIANFFSTWIQKGAELNFHMRSGEVLTGKLLFYGRYEFAVQVAEDKAAVLIMKHAVDWIERLPNSTGGDKK